jgi:hypothetical protein
MKELIVLGFASRQLAEVARSCGAERGRQQMKASRPTISPTVTSHQVIEISSIMPPRRTTRLRLPAGPSRGSAGCPRLARDAGH